MNRPLSLGIFFVVGLLIRGPFFLVAKINWDEGTFIVIADHVLRSQLPFVELWDLKSPFVFLLTALGLLIGNGHLIGVRVLGWVVVSLAGWVVYLSTLKLVSFPKAAWIAGMLVIWFSSLEPGSFATLSEHYALLPLGVMMLLLNQPSSVRNIFLTGLCLGLTISARLNLAYVLPFMPVVLGLRATPCRWRQWLRYCLIFGMGCFVPIGLILGTYLAAGHWEALSVGLFQAALAYSDGGGGFWTVLRHIIDRSFYLHQAGLWGLSYIGVGCLIYQIRDRRGTDRVWLVHLCVAGAILVSIVKTGSRNDHYLIQLLPWLALFGSYAVEHLRSHRFGKIMLAVLAFLVLLPITKPVQTAWSNWNKPDPHYAATEFLTSQDRPIHSGFFTSTQIMYHLLNITPPKIVHPSNLGRPHVLKVVIGPQATPRSVLADILETSPDVIELRDHLWYLKNAPEAEQLLRTTVARDYELIWQTAGLNIYRRKPQ